MICRSDPAQASHIQQIQTLILVFPVQDRTHPALDPDQPSQIRQIQSGARVSKPEIIFTFQSAQQVRTSPPQPFRSPASPSSTRQVQIQTHIGSKYTHDQTPTPLRNIAKPPAGAGQWRRLRRPFICILALPMKVEQRGRARRRSMF